MGMGQQMAEEICLRSGFSPKTAIKDLTDGQLSALTDTLNQLKDNLESTTYSPRVIYVNQQPIDFLPFAFVNYEGYGKKEFDTLSLAIDEFYTALFIEKTLGKKKKQLESIIKKSLKKAQKKLQSQQEDLIKTQDIKGYQIYGEVILANAYTFKEVPVGSVTLPNFYDDYNDITIPIPAGYDLYQTAEHYFRRYKKGKAMKLYVEKNIPITMADVDYLENLLFSIQKAENLTTLTDIEEEIYLEKIMERPRIKGKKQKEKIHEVSGPRRIVYDGYEIYIGRNNLQNDRVTFEIADDNDMWFHARNIPGSHVIIKNHKKEDFPDALYLLGARLAGYFSKYQNDMYVEVDYTEAKYVKKIKGGKPGMVTYDKFYTIRAELSPATLLPLLKEEASL